MIHPLFMTPLLRIKDLITDKFCDFSSDIDYNNKTGVFSDIIYLILNQCNLGVQRVPPADTKCPPARSAS